ncbi:extracellular solute-binding protein [Streptomyces sp. NPDC006197]|uniref:extracellular solute-binding protein n=1 Tax=Streptomyces sp. NPDC006197 TaxID=3156685 RepID=UPI0033B3A7AE
MSDAPGVDKKAYLPWKWDQATTADGRTIGLGTDVGPMAVCYRQALFKATGLPSDLESVGRPWAGDWDLAVKVVQGRTSQGLKMFDTPWQTAFSKSTFAATVCPSWQQADIQQFSGPSNKGKWNIAQPPAVGNWGGSFLAVPASGKHVDEAKKLVAWLTGPEQQAKVFQKAGNIPADQAAYDLPAVVSAPMPGAAAVNHAHGESDRSPWPGSEGVNFRLPSGDAAEMGWAIDPAGLYDLLMATSRAPPGLPPVITENGGAFSDVPTTDGQIHDHDRIDYLHRHLAAVHRAIAANAVPGL